MTQKSSVIIGVTAHKTNKHDSKTLKAALTHASKHRNKPSKEVICDRGYRGKKEVDGATKKRYSIPKRTKTKEV